MRHNVGGLAVFFFGDIMQLKPCQAKYIFDEPRCADYQLPFHIQPHWQLFTIITLQENHRQGDDHTYADLLNRLRVGDHTEDDLALLATRVRPTGHPDTLGATYIAGTNETVQSHNTLRLNELHTELLEIEAINHHPTIPNFRPTISEKKGTVGNSAFRQTLSLKTGARVMLIHNLDTVDGLTNGTRGTLVAVIKDQHQNPMTLMVKMDEEYQGAHKRASTPALQHKYPACTPIEKVQFSYSLSKTQTHASSTATVYQFPLALCYAATCHKFQGQEIAKPDKAAMDLSTVFEPAMAYVMLSRVPSLEQLYILNALPQEKLHAHPDALQELRRMESVSININPTPWENTTRWAVKVAALNCHSLLPKLPEIKADPVLAYADILCFSETWLTHNNHQQPSLHIDGFALHLNSTGPGKGLATYYRPDKFLHHTDFNSDNMQITMLNSAQIDVICVYKSNDNNALLQNLLHFINPLKTTLVCGDFNICLAENPHNHVSQSLQQLGFSQLIQEATHFEGGHLDHAYFHNNADLTAHPSLYSPYYTARDHDALLLTVTKSTTPL